MKILLMRLLNLLMNTGENTDDLNQEREEKRRVD